MNEEQTYKFYRFLVYMIALVLSILILSLTLAHVFTCYVDTTALQHGYVQEPQYGHWVKPVNITTTTTQVQP